MPYATNPLDGNVVYFEENNSSGEPVILYGGFLDAVQSVKQSKIAQSLGQDHHLVFVDHRGLGNSAKPHDPPSYAMPLRVADATAVLELLGIDRAHFIGLSWGGRLCFGIGELAAHRVRSLVISGQQPYEWPDSPLTRVVTAGLQAAQTQGAEALIRSMEDFWQTRFPEPNRSLWLQVDPAALQAAWTAVLSEGVVSEYLENWDIPCLIFMGAGDEDFLEQARRAADAIPGAEFVSVVGANHLAAHIDQGDPVLEAINRTLERGSKTA